MPVVHIDMIKRPAAAKRAVARAVTDALVQAIGVSPESICIVINEMSREQYAVAGVLLADQKAKTASKTKTKTKKARTSK